MLGRSAPLHPRNKQDTGLRLCLAAEDVLYGKKNVSQGPILKDVVFSGNTVTCRFTNVGAGLMVGSENYLTPLSPASQVVGGKLTGFALSDNAKGGTFYAAEATIVGVDQVKITGTGTPAGCALTPGATIHPATSTI